MNMNLLFALLVAVAVPARSQTAGQGGAAFDVTDILRQAKDRVEKLGKAAEVAGKALAAQAAEGPDAALAFEKKYRGKDNKAGWGQTQEGRFESTPVSFYETDANDPIAQNIIPMTTKLWTPKELIEDFKKNKTAEQEAILVIVKTEYCCTNRYRPCAVATASIEKRSTAELKKFRVYGAWVKNEKALPKGMDPKAKAAWDDKVIDTYKFEQGPGATLDMIDPASGRMSHTDAVQMELYLPDFETRGGKTEKLEATLKAFLAAGKKK